MALYQIRYRIAATCGRKPTKRTLGAIRRRWLKTGTARPGVAVEAICWGTARGDVRREIAEGLKRKTHRLGQPGIVKTLNRPTWTLCDYDVDEPPSMRRFVELGRMLGLKLVTLEYDRTARGWHVQAEWNRRLKPLEQLAMQAVLGSDYRREAFGLARIFSGKGSNPRWNLLFKEKL